MSKAEILAQLPHLSAQQRAEVQAKLDELAGNAWQDRGELSDADKRTARIRSPRVADPRQIRDFMKQIVAENK